MIHPVRLSIPHALRPLQPLPPLQVYYKRTPVTDLQSIATHDGQHKRACMPHLDRLPRHHVSTKVAPIRQPDAEHPSLPCFLFFVRVLFYFLTFHFTNKCLQLGSLRLRPPPTSPPPPPRRITASTNGHHVTP